MGCHVGIFRIIDLAKAVYCKLLDLVDYLATTIVSLSGISFGVLVGADGLSNVRLKNHFCYICKD